MDKKEVEQFEDWWTREGQFLDPDTEDVPWFDKRKGLAAMAYEAALATAARSVSVSGGTFQMIVKCQHSVSTSAEAPQMLIYDRARKWQWSGDVTPEWRELFAKFGLRFFANVKVFKDGRVPEFVTKVPDLDWSGGVTVAKNRHDGGTLATIPYGSQKQHSSTENQK